MQLMTVTLAAISVVSTSQLYYDSETNHSSNKSENYELENQRYKGLEQTNYAMSGMYEMEQSFIQNGQNLQQMQSQDKGGHGNQNGHQAELMPNDINSEQLKDCKPNEYIQRIGQLGNDFSENKMIGDDLRNDELKKTPKIYEYKFQGNAHGYQYNYYTENGIQAYETGETDKVKQVIGAYAYIGDDGKPYTVTYVADEHGFSAEGEHLPTPLPMPVAIVEALEKNAIDEANGILDDGQYKEFREIEGQAKSLGHKTPVITWAQNSCDDFVLSLTF